jgi:hypothetical protein
MWNAEFSVFFVCLWKLLIYIVGLSFLNKSFRIVRGTRHYININSIKLNVRKYNIVSMGNIDRAPVKVVFQELNIIYINNKWVVSEELNFKWITKQNLSASSNLFLFIFVGVDLLLWFYISFIYELMVSVIIIGMSVIYRSPIGFYFSPV